MSLCFDEAYQALRSRRISEEEYLHQVLAHFCGIRHPADEKAGRPWELMINDPVGNAIREAALNSPHSRPESVSQLEKLFTSALKDDAKAVKTIVSQLASDASGQPIPLQAIATFAALHSDAEVLRFCLQMGATLSDRNTSVALEYAARGPALLHVLYEYDWRDMRTSTLAFNRLLEWSLHTGPEELNWFLIHGARIDKETIRHAVHGAPLKAACIQVLVDRLGVELFNGTRLLQSAAKRGRNDIVKVLLDAGVNVDELIPPSPTHEDGEVELTALYEAVYKRHEETVQLLLQRGADPNKQVCAEGLNTPLKLAEGHGYARIVVMLRMVVEGKEKSGGDTYHTAKL
ncbi:uncharacterized protein RCC_09715 [Lecanosticta acicola]|uniref:Uncharacterized protein RCC_09715 n=1 Tax=Lecanosticta acicola TaxID=111012 RepID=A0AAI8Z907_9PEZI|nr:uncharacterized protein RCC_09715 [Lecanosticta acicola]